MSLADRLAASIVAGGPMPIGRYMDACLHDPEFGYYATRPALGADGDFITAPHVSQTFGELIGIWACDLYRQLGAPARVRLVELGPGDGTLLADVLRAIVSADPAFARALEVILVERSAPLIAVQRARLCADGRKGRWLQRPEDLPTDAPLIIVGNEFLDCLPIEQAIATPDGWKRRAVGLDRSGRLAFTAAGEAPRARVENAAGAPMGAVVEWSRAAETVGAALGDRIARAGGGALLLDYGDGAGDGRGDTLQAVRAHRKEDPLAHPGEADLTAHVRFAPVLAAAGEAGAEAQPLTTQRDFLLALGIDGRARMLAASRPERAAAIRRQIGRLTDPGAMGGLFKAASFHAPGLAPAGFAGGA